MKRTLFVCSVGMFLVFSDAGWAVPAEPAVGQSVPQASPSSKNEDDERLAQVAALKDKNLIANPSLEDDLAGRELPAGWSTYLANETKYRCRVADGGRTGQKCLLIEGEGTRAVVFTNGIALDRSKRYALRGWAKLEGDPKARAIIKFNYFHEGKYLGANDLVGVTSQQKDWTLLAKTDQADDFPEASMLWVSCNLEGKGRASFDDLELIAFDRQQLPADFEARYGMSNVSPEFRVLQRRVGTWDAQTTIKAGPRFPNELHETSVQTIEWVLGKKFLQVKDRNQTTKAEGLTLMGYDEQSRVYRSWYFDSWGNQPRGESTGHWDEATQTLTFQSTDPEQVTATATLHLSGDDQAQWRIVWKDKGGNVVMELEGQSQRRK